MGKTTVIYVKFLREKLLKSTSVSQNYSKNKSGFILAGPPCIPACSAALAEAWLPGVIASWRRVKSSRLYCCCCCCCSPILIQTTRRYVDDCMWTRYSFSVDSDPPGITLLACRPNRLRFILEVQTTFCETHQSPFSRALVPFLFLSTCARCLKCNNFGCMIIYDSERRILLPVIGCFAAFGLLLYWVIFLLLFVLTLAH